MLALWAGWWPGGADGDYSPGRGWVHKGGCRTETGGGGPETGSHGWAKRPRTWWKRDHQTGGGRSREGDVKVGLSRDGQELHMPTWCLALGARRLSTPPTALRS